VGDEQDGLVNLLDTSEVARQGGLHASNLVVSRNLGMPLDVGSSMNPDPIVHLALSDELLCISYAKSNLCQFYLFDELLANAFDTKYEKHNNEVDDNEDAEEFWENMSDN